MSTIVFQIAKVLLAALAIAFASWLSEKKPEMAGFIIALPLVSILALMFSYVEHQDASASFTFAKSILVAVPISYLFFFPFFVAERFHLNFWMSYGAGIVLLIAGYFLHQFMMQFIGSS